MQKKRLLDNSRFYILASSLLLSLASFSFLRLQIQSDQLFLIRSEQVFGLFAILFWYCALIISPLGYAIGKNRTKKLEFARRAIGVSAFYFALLHGCSALWGQLGGVENLQFLPSLFQWSLLAGGGAFFILTLMALTSFDRVVSFMTFPRWKLLHRLVYIAGLLVMLHIWTIGTHLAYSQAQLLAFVLLLILIGLELYRTTKVMNAKYFRLDKIETTTLYISLLAVAATLLMVLPIFVQNYHSRHTDHRDSSHSEEHR